MKVLLSWSGGKDCAWALHVLGQRPGLATVALLTTFDRATRSIAMQGVALERVQAQADAAGLPLWTVPLPSPCPNPAYERIMAGVCGRARGEGIEAVAFGDLFLEDVRAYRERQMQGTGLAPLFPLWGRDPAALAREMIEGGLRATIVAVDEARLPRTWIGREFDLAFLAEIPPGTDPCGENGEFHTFVNASPEFRLPEAGRGRYAVARSSRTQTSRRFRYFSA